MKKQINDRKTGTFEDLVFEGRNKSYGAFELNRKRSKYLLIGFLISFSGFSAAIAVPFFNAFRIDEVNLRFEDDRAVELTDIREKHDFEVPHPPLPPPIIDELERKVAYVTPVIVENLDETAGVEFTTEVIEYTDNKFPEVLEVFPNKIDNEVIPEAGEVVIFNPQEKAMFMGGDENSFRKWVSNNIVFPAIAIDGGIKGKVIVEFCVNSKGDVVDIKLLKKLDPAVDTETLRVISSSPKWTPAKQGGTPVKTRYVIPFMFDLI